jgi:hypothetical protein
LRTLLPALAVFAQVSGAAASTLNQNASWTIDRAGSTTKFRSVAYGDSIYAGYNGSVTSAAKYAAPTVNAEYRLWNLVMFNEPAAGMMRWLLGMPGDAAIARDGSINILRLMLAPDGIRPHLVNWRAVCADSLLWIQREAMADGPGSEATALLAELAELAGMLDIAPAGDLPNLDRRALPFMPLELARDGVQLSLFTTITTLGTPRDVTVHELRLESFFPADDATARWFRERFSG